MTHIPPSHLSKMLRTLINMCVCIIISRKVTVDPNINTENGVSKYLHVGGSFRWMLVFSALKQMCLKVQKAKLCFKESSCMCGQGLRHIEILHKGLSHNMRKGARESTTMVKTMILLQAEVKPWLIYWRQWWADEIQGMTSWLCAGEQSWEWGRPTAQLSHTENSSRSMRHREGEEYKGGNRVLQNPIAVLKILKLWFCQVWPSQPHLCIFVIPWMCIPVVTKCLFFLWIGLKFVLHIQGTLRFLAS